MKKLNLILLSLVSSILLSTAAFGLSLNEAKQQGMVGEQVTGYLGVISADPKAAALAQNINAKRKQKYQEIAQRNGASLQSVEKLAGKTALEKTPAGQLINLGDGWKKK